ncbi:nucleoside triphosphate pyrophosphohydrolase [Dactylosporangium sp. NPDC050688]|uniref:nucleoside triphosphate pyrophosphohydrolase n=1 Tax=Dactylosporangium sp. NPDC050688 TaxID=3157217 RepID=UPI0033FF298B
MTSRPDNAAVPQPTTSGPDNAADRRPTTAGPDKAAEPQPTTAGRGKLVRDRIPHLISADGGVALTRVAAAGEHLPLLRDKLAEEVAEFLDGNDVTELADILEVVYALAAALGTDAGGLDRIRPAKLVERGGFGERLVLTGVIPAEPARGSGPP